MDVAFYTPKQSPEIEQRLTTAEARAVMPLWKWRFERAASSANLHCFALAEDPADRALGCLRYLAS